YLLAAPAYRMVSDLALHDALPIWDEEALERLQHQGLRRRRLRSPVPGGSVPPDRRLRPGVPVQVVQHGGPAQSDRQQAAVPGTQDRKSTRLNSSHVKISYAVFCLK